MKKFMLYALTYVMVTLAATFGTITTNNLISRWKSNANVSTSQTESGEVKQETDGEKLLNNLLEMGGTDINVNFDIYETETKTTTSTFVDANLNQTAFAKINFNGSLSIADIENIKLSGNVDAKIGDKDIVIDIAYLDGKIYLSNQTMNIKLETSSISKVVELLPTLGLNLNLGDSFANLDVDSLLTNFQNLKAQKLPSGDLLMPFALTDDFVLNIYTSKDYVIKSVQASRIKLQDKVASLSASLVKNTSLTIENPEQEKEYVDVTNTLSILDSVKEILTNKKLHLDLDAGLEGGINCSLNGQVDLDFNSDVDAFANFKVNFNGTTHEIQLGYIGQDVYLTFNNLKVMLKKDQIEQTLAVISDNFDMQKAQENMLVAIAKIIPGFELSEILEGDFSNININNLLKFSKGEQNELNITLFGKALGIENDLNLTIKFDENNQFSSLSVANIQLLDSKFSANIVYKNVVTIPELNQSEFVELKDVPQLATAVINTSKQIANSKVVTLNLNTSLDVKGREVQLSGVVSLDFGAENLKAYASLAATFNNKTFNIKVSVQDKKIYLAAENLKFQASFENINDLIEVIKTSVLNQTQKDSLESILNISKDVNQIKSLIVNGIDKLPKDAILSLISNAGKLEVVLNKDLLKLDKDLTISIDYANKISGLVVKNIAKEGISVQADISLNDTPYTFEIVEEEYTSLENLDKFVSALAGTINQIKAEKRFAANINTTISKGETTFALVGNIAYAENLLYLNASLTYANKTMFVEMYLDENTIYLDVDGLKVSLPVSEIESLTSLFKGNIDIQAILKQILPTLDINQIKNGNWQSLSLQLIKGITIGQTSATVVLDKDFLTANDDLSIALTFGQKLTGLIVNGFSINGLDVNLSASVIDSFGIPTRSKEYSSLENLTAFVSAAKQTISSVLDSKQIAFNLSSTIAKNGKTYAISGKVYLNFANLQDKFELDKLDVYASIDLTYQTTYSAVLRLKNGVLYIDYQNLKVKVSVESVSNLIDVLAENIPDFDKSALTEFIQGSVIEKVLNKDYSALSVSLIKNVSLTASQFNITLAKELLNLDKDINLCVLYNEDIDTVKISDLAIKGFEIDLDAKLNQTFVPAAIDESQYQNLTGIENVVVSALNTIEEIKNSKAIALSLSNMQIKLKDKAYFVDGVVYLDFANAISKDEQGQTSFNLARLNAYANISAVDNLNNTHSIKLNLTNGTIYAQYNNLKLSLDVANLQDIVSIVKQIKFISENLSKQDLSNVSMRDLVEQAKQSSSEQSDFDAIEFAKSILPGLDLDALINKDLSKLDLSVLTHISINDQTLRVIFAKHLFGASSDLELNINFSNKITGLNINGLEIKGISASGDIAILSSFELPEVDATEYTSLNNLKSAVNSALNTAIEVVDSKHISFGLQTQLVHSAIKTDANSNPTSLTETIVDLLPSSKARFEWGNAYTMVDGVNKFDFTKMNIKVNFDVVTITNTYEYTNGIKNTVASNSVTRNHTIEISYINNVAYIRYNNMYVKINGENIKQIVENLCNLLGVETGSGLMDNIKNLMANTSSDSILSKLSLNMIQSISLTDSNFSLVADLSNMGFATDVFKLLKLDVVYSETGLSQVTLKDLTYNNISIGKLDISLNQFEAIGNAPEGEFIDLSSASDLLEAINNSKEFKDFEIDGSAKLKINVIGINIDWNIPVNAKIKLLENGKFEASVKIGEIPVVVGVNNDVPFKTGNVSAGDKRMLYIYIKDEMVYIYRTEKVATLSGTKTYEKKMKVHMDTFLEDPLYYLLQYGFGMSDSIMSAINESLNKQRQNPMDYSNILKGFEASSNYYALTLNLKELAENDQLDTMTLGVRTTDYNGKPVVSGITLDVFMPVASAVEITIKSDNLNLANIGGTTDMQSMYDFVANNSGLQEGAAWDAYNGDWKLSSQREFTLSFVTNCDQTIADVRGVAGSEFALPVLTDYYLDTATERTYYSFAGWYTSKDFATGTEYTENILPRKDLTIYAKWETSVKKYVTISFVTNGGEAKDSITLLEGESFELPTYVDLLIEVVGNTTFTKQFEGWFVDQALTNEFETSIAPSQDIVLYAKWVVMDSATSFQLTVYDAGQKLLVRRVIEGQNISLSGNLFKDDTLYYLNSDYTNQIDLNTFKMPNQDIELHIRNKYTVKVVSTKGTVLDYSNSLYQGETFSVAAQSSVDWDTYENGKLSQHIYLTFYGYYIGETKLDNISSIAMPNQDIEVVAKWDEVAKNYYTISFSKDTNVTSAYKSSISFPVESLTVLEGETINLNNYKPKWVYSAGKWVVTWWHYDFEGWSTSKGGSNITSLTVTGDTTLYANWDGIVKTGEN